MQPLPDTYRQRWPEKACFPFNFYAADNKQHIPADKDLQAL